MVQHAISQLWRGQYLEMLERLASLQQAQEMKHTVQHADVFVGSDDGGAMPIDGQSADQIAFSAGGAQIQMQRRDDGRRPWGSKNNRALESRARRVARHCAHEAGEGAREFRARGEQRGVVRAAN